MQEINPKVHRGKTKGYTGSPHSNNTTGIQILIIVKKIKALDFLLKKSVLTTVVF